MQTTVPGPLQTNRDVICSRSRRRDACSIATAATAVSAGTSACGPSEAGRILGDPLPILHETLPQDVVKLGFDLSLRVGKRAVSTIGFHAEIYKARPDVSAIVHTRSPAAAILSSKREVLGMYDIHAAPFYGRSAGSTATSQRRRSRGRTACGRARLE